MPSKREIRQAETALRRALVDRERLKVRHARERASQRSELRQASAVVLSAQRRVRRLAGQMGTRTARVQAGPAAIGRVVEVLRRGPLAQNAIVRETGLNDGTVSYALRALTEEEQVELTGQTIGRSREFRLRPQAAVRRRV